MMIKATNLIISSHLAILQLIGSQFKLWRENYRKLHEKKNYDDNTLTEKLKKK